MEAELATVQELPVGQLQLEQQLLAELGRSLYLDLCWLSELKMDDLCVFLTWTAAARGQLAHFQKQLDAVSKPSRHPNKNCSRFAKKKVKHSFWTPTLRRPPRPKLVPS